MKNKRRWFDNFMASIKDHHITSFGAHSAYYIIISAIPISVMTIFLLNYFKFESESLPDLLSLVLPENLTNLISGLLTEGQVDTASTPVFWITLIMIWWASGRAILVIKTGLNTIYNIKETRNYFLLRAIATLYTLLFILMLAGALSFLGVGNRLYQYLIIKWPALKTIEFFTNFSKIISLFVFLAFFFMLFYKFLPNGRIKLLHTIPGAMLTAGGWILCSRIISIYYEYAPNLSSIYGSLTTIVIIMLWLFACMITFFVGAEFNANLFKEDVYLDYDDIDIM